MPRKKQLVNPKQGERLTELLRDSNISQEKLGEILGFQQQAISFFVTGKRALPQWAAEGIESRLGIRAAYILGLSDIKTQKEIEDLFDAGWNDADKSDNGADPFLSCLGYRVKPELIENTDAVPWGTGHGEDEVIPPECLAWNFSGK